MGVCDGKGVLVKLGGVAIYSILLDGIDNLFTLVVIGRQVLKGMALVVVLLVGAQGFVCLLNTVCQKPYHNSIGAFIVLVVVILPNLVNNYVLRRIV